MGKALEAKKVDVLIINGDLKPSHHYVLENRLKVECIDRVRLVLEIFMLRANNKESRLQVERARLRYEVPLLREWIHSAKMGEHPGFLGGGEYAVDVYYDLIKKRMRKIDEELSRERESNDQRRLHRKRKGFHLVSLAGYTNAGKSSLMKSLTKEQVLIEDRLFSTLSTTTKKLEGTSLPILVTDTIGFLHDLPPFIIEAFKNTINEIFNADLILLVIDASDEWTELERKLSTSETVLFPEVEMERIFLVVNKMDLLEIEERQNLLDKLRERWQGSEIFPISALKGGGVPWLEDAMVGRFSHRTGFDIVLPQTGGTEEFLTWLRKSASITKLQYANDVRVAGSCDEADVKKIQTTVLRLGGRVKIDESPMPAR
ncbi:MAG: GTPase HflX [Methanomassiliicoccales archaeon]|nr:GTPase HflX [Methanomassiliicoccales archaeon]